MASGKADIAVVGLAVMGQNLALNMADHGYTVAVFNRTASKVDDFLAGEAAGNSRIIGTRSLDDLAAALKRPRRVMLMVKAGGPVDDFIDSLVPYLDKGDCVVDGGNSHFSDTARRAASCAAKGLLYVGVGVSGGEEGARRGPSLMPGGHTDAWQLVKDIFQSISAKAPGGEPCCDWVGPGGAGHFVKMTHNGIEYGDMQLISEAYLLMKQGLGMGNEEMGGVFAEWNRGELDSYLVGITADILGYRDDRGEYVVDSILDTAGQKGTGRWTSESALEMGVPVTLITEAVYARFLSAMKEERDAAAQIFPAKTAGLSGGRDAFVEHVRKALLASKIVSYAQGFMLMRQAATRFAWDLDYGSIALMWRGGCVIRSAFLGKIRDAFTADPGLKNLLCDGYFSSVIERCEESWRTTVAEAVRIGVPVPAFASALQFYDGYRNARLGANLIQAQRDYFGAHTYERLDSPRGTFFHTNWTGRGGSVSSSGYTA